MLSGILHSQFMPGLQLSPPYNSNLIVQLKVVLSRAVEVGEKGTFGHLRNPNDLRVCVRSTPPPISASTALRCPGGSGKRLGIG